MSEPWIYASPPREPWYSVAADTIVATLMCGFVLAWAQVLAWLAGQ